MSSPLSPLNPLTPLQSYNLQNQDALASAYSDLIDASNNPANGPQVQANTAAQAANALAAMTANWNDPNNPLLSGATIPSVTPVSSSSPMTAKGASAGATTQPSQTSSPWLSKLFGGSTAYTEQDYLIRLAAIIGGLILIAGAIFTFDSVQKTVISVAKKGAELGAAS